jgi:hypothetical protein
VGCNEGNTVGELHIGTVGLNLGDLVGHILSWFDGLIVAGWKGAVGCCVGCWEGTGEGCGVKILGVVGALELETEDGVRVGSTVGREEVNADGVLVCELEEGGRVGTEDGQ